MSYDLALWDGPRPRDDAEASRIFDELWDAAQESEHVPPSPAIRALIEELETHWPEDHPDAPWASFPLAGDAHDGFLCVNLAWNTPIDVLRIVVGVAHRLGIVCFDPQAEAVLDVTSLQDLPDGPELSGSSIPGGGPQRAAASSTSGAQSGMGPRGSGDGPDEKWYEPTAKNARSVQPGAGRVLFRDLRDEAYDEWVTLLVYEAVPDEASAQHLYQDFAWSDFSASESLHAALQELFERVPEWQDAPGDASHAGRNRTRLRSFAFPKDHHEIQQRRWLSDWFRTRGLNVIEFWESEDQYR